MSPVLDWVAAHDWLLATAAVVSLVTFVGTLITVPILIARMRPDYFVRTEHAPQGFLARHPVVRFLGRLSKNILGLVLLVMGIIMLFMPGQGVLTALIGISLIDFPGKRRLEIRLARQRHVQRSIAWIRRRAKRPPLLLPETTHRRAHQSAEPPT